MTTGNRHRLRQEVLPVRGDPKASRQSPISEVVLTQTGGTYSLTIGITKTNGDISCIYT